MLLAPAFASAPFFLLLFKIPSFPFPYGLGTWMNTLHAIVQFSVVESARGSGAAGVAVLARFHLTITEHVPPPPFGLSSVYPLIELPYDTSDEHLKTLALTRLVVTCPPIEANSDTGGVVAKKPPAKATLKVDGPIAVEDGRGPQLVVCTITPQNRHSKPFHAAAKNFDPLYYSFQNENAPHRPVTTTLKADSDYSIEAAAYAHLQKTG